MGISLARNTINVAPCTSKIQQQSVHHTTYQHAWFPPGRPVHTCSRPFIETSTDNAERRGWATLLALASATQNRPGLATPAVAPSGEATSGLCSESVRGVESHGRCFCCFIALLDWKAHQTCAERERSSRSKDLFCD